MLSWPITKEILGETEVTGVIEVLSLINLSSERGIRMHDRHGRHGLSMQCFHVSGSERVKCCCIDGTDLLNLCVENTAS